MSLKIKSFSDAKNYHKQHMNKLRMLEGISPHMRELFERISDSDFGLTLVECARSDDRMRMNETKFGWICCVLTGTSFWLMVDTTTEHT
jgi:hypothetical protein